MKLDKAVLKESAFVTFGVLILSVLLQSVFLIMGKWNISVLLGNVLTAIPSAFNFLLMGITVQKAVSQPEEKAKKLIALSMFLRTLMLFVFALIGALNPEKFNLICVILPLFFPRLVIFARPLFKTDKSDPDDLQIGNKDDEKEELSSSDSDE